MTTELKAMETTRVLPRTTENRDKFHSSHYESNGIEVIEYISSNKLDFNRASIIKYADRCGKKQGQEKLDIKKIIDYAMLLAFQEGIEITREDIHKLVDYRFDWKGKN
ncbi:PF11753 family protein [Vibrio phage BUCT194]|uniref:PF11753 family protein n=1 Tax=Vibrio phage BUCT194 TaxID=2859072 RepID=A0AAE8XFR3_9CAUD|nr:PF11753 family protein [Vibrio phage BUCT194]UAW01129.1 PF11753 family protein [Vibrio phage BUCT194]